MEHRKYTHVLYDWDGTIQHTLCVWHDACAQQLENRGVHLDALTIARDIVPHLQEANKHGVDDVDVFIQTVISTCIPLLVEAQMNTSLWNTIAALRTHGVQQTIVSSSSEKAIQEAILRHNMDISCFTHIITRALVPETKPNPAPLLYALDQLQTAPEHALMIGDSPVDIIAAQNAGIDSLWLYPSENTNYYDENAIRDLKPTYVAHSGEQVKNIVLTTK